MITFTLLLAAALDPGGAGAPGFCRNPAAGGTAGGPADLCLHGAAPQKPCTAAGRAGVRQAFVPAALARPGRQPCGALGRCSARRFAALAAALAVAWVCVAPQRMAILDDLVHWALNAKQLCFMEHFPTAAEIASTYGDYPPGGQLLGFSAFWAGLFQDPAVLVEPAFAVCAGAAPLGTAAVAQKVLAGLFAGVRRAAALLAFPPCTTAIIPSAW